MAPKTMHSLYFGPQKENTIYKAKGITSNYENSKFVNVTILRGMILEDDTNLHVHNPKKIK